MLDLDSLAEKRAKILNEQEENWRRALWGENFQKVVKNMTDGEVETLLSSCPSLEGLERVLDFLKNHEQAPFSSLQEAADEKGMNLTDWIRNLP